MSVTKLGKVLDQLADSTLELHTPEWAWSGLGHPQSFGDPHNCPLIHFQGDLGDAASMPFPR